MTPFLRSLAAVVALGAGAACSAGEVFQGLAVEVRGEGRPVLMIPGLNSAGAVWDETCAALQADRLQCHIVTLPGFAGQAPVDHERFLPAMRDRLLAYVAERGLERPVVFGHSLGGVLGMMLAIERPDALERLLIVDSLPFLPAAQNPAATVESSRAFAEMYRQSLLGSDDEAYASQSRMVAATMTNQPDRVDTIVQWSIDTDRATSAAAFVDLMTTDLRGELSAIEVPTLVLGAWAPYAGYGATRDSVLATFQAQYEGLDGVRIELSPSGHHFLMWDDPEWLQDQVRAFVVDGG